MPPLLREAIGSILRRVLGYGGSYLVARGFWTDDAAALYIAGAAGVLLDVGWSFWQKFTAQRRLVTAQAMSGPVTERQVNNAIRLGKAPSVLLPVDEAPARINKKSKVEAAAEAALEAVGHQDSGA